MRELQPGDNIAYLFDREQVTRAYIQGIRNAVLAQAARAVMVPANSSED